MIRYSSYFRSCLRKFIKSSVSDFQSGVWCKGGGHTEKLCGGNVWNHLCVILKRWPILQICYSWLQFLSVYSVRESLIKVHSVLQSRTEFSFLESTIHEKKVVGLKVVSVLLCDHRQEKRYKVRPTERKINVIHLEY